VTRPSSGILTISGLLLSIFITACGGSKKDAPPPAAGGNQIRSISVDGFLVTTREISESIEVPGTLLANETTEIHPEVAGRLTQLNVAEGRFVSRGTVLAKIYDGDLVAQLRKLEVQLKIAEQTESRQAQLLKIQGISQQDYDLSLLNVNNIKADIEIVQANISKTVIRAPYSGRLGLKNVSPGAFVTSTTVITTISQTDPLKLDFTVPEKYSERIKNGQKVNFTIQGSKTQYSAVVRATEVSLQENTRSLLVRSLVENRKSTLLPGTFANVALQFDPNPNAIMVPTQAIIPQARGQQVISYNGGKAKFIDVETGVRDSSYVQIMSGIEKGDTVVVTGLLSIRPGSSIQLNKIINP